MDSLRTKVTGIFMSAGPGEWLHWIGTAAPGGHIRKFVLQAHHLDELVALGTLTAQVVRFPEAAVASGLDLLVSSGTQAWQDDARELLRTAA